jgi:hypothetical protein
MQVYSKAELKKQGYKSPNKADALCLTYALGDRALAEGGLGREDDIVRSHDEKPIEALVGY